jgi:two-component system nitrate/nitrite response regulator NarL
VDTVVRSDPVTVVVVDDHDVFRDGLVRLLAEKDGISVVGDAADAEAALRTVARVAPDVVVMDLNLPGLSGIEAIRRLGSSAPQTRVLVLTISVAESDVLHAILAGACGYLLKDASIDEIVAGVRAAAAGESLISPRIATGLLERLRSVTVEGDGGRQGDLTDRELEVLGLVAEGLDNVEIARVLFISPQTAKNHVSNILAKLQLENRIQAAVHAVRRGLV